MQGYDLGQCINIILMMTPAQRTYSLTKIQKHLDAVSVQQAEQIFRMAQNIWTINGGR